MKSEHRHELETNTLAKHLDVWMARLQPYVGTMVGIVAVVAAAIVGWSLYKGSASSRQTEAWDAYNQAVAGYSPNLEQLRESAEEFPGTKMKELADVTWADGQVWMATREYIPMRSGAMEALDRAQSAYESVLRTSSDRRLENRARLGLARIYEMRNELDKAKAEYEKVEGSFAAIAKMRIERLAEPEVKETYEWLASAQAPRPRSPLGPGIPGQAPDFSAGDFQLPAGPGTSPGGAPAGQGSSLDTLFEGLNLGGPPVETTDRYEADGDSEPATTDDKPVEEVIPAAPAAVEAPATPDAATSDAEPDVPAAE